MLSKRVCLATCLLILAGTSGCSEPESSPNGWGPSLPDTESDPVRQALGDLRGIPPHADRRLEEAMEEFRMHGRIAAHLVNGPLKGDMEARIASLDAFNRAILDHHMSGIVDEQLTEEKMREFHEVHAGEFGNASYHLAHIFVRAGEGMAVSRLDAARERVDEIARLLDEGHDFEALVKSHSEDAATREKGGDLGWLDAETGNRDLVRAAADLEEGETSSPIRTDRGFHVLKLLEAPSIEEQSFEEVESRVRYRLRKELVAREFERLKEEALSED